MLNVVALFGPSADVNVNACCRLTVLQVPGNLLLKLTSEVQLCSRIHSPEKCRVVTVSLQHQRGSILLNSPWSPDRILSLSSSWPRFAVQARHEVAGIFCWWINLFLLLHQDPFVLFTKFYYLGITIFYFTGCVLCSNHDDPPMTNIFCRAVA